MLMGTETEYGITAPEASGLDAHALSALVVDACPVPATESFADLHNRVLGNGARLYVDHGHPEYSSPETTTPTDALTWELAGDALVLAAARAASEATGTPIRVYKNNTDGKGSSYGYHENHLLARATPFEHVVAALPAFLVTRTVFAGAGRVGLGPRGEASGFQLGQRPDFFERLVGLDTMRHRGLVNTRDEPHARPSRWRRLHVITGDATRNPHATWLKIGTLALALQALEAGRLRTVALADPVDAFRRVSRDLTLAEPLRLADGRTATALAIQEAFRDDCAALAADMPLAADTPPAAAAPLGEAAELLAAWTAVLDDLRTDPARTTDRLDWPAKLAILQRYRARAALAWDHPRLAQIDLAWADLDPDASVFGTLERSGRVRPFADPVAVRAATATPPTDTRAFLRGTMVARHPDAVVSATWDSLLLRDSRGALHPVRLSEPLAGTAAGFDASAPLDRLIAQYEGSTQQGRGWS